MNRIGILYGFLLGIFACAVGSYFFIQIFTTLDFDEAIREIQMFGLLGRVIKLGAILNLAVFFVLLYFKKDDIARGVIAATIVLAITTFFV